MWFLGTWAGTAIIGLALFGWAIFQWANPGAIWLAGGSLAYVIGTFGVTIVCNVPLNNRLDAVDSADEQAAAPVWEHYLSRWVFWNTVRTIAAAIATVLYAVGLAV